MLVGECVCTCVEETKGERESSGERERERERENVRETEKAKAINSAQEMSERNFPCKLKFLAKKIKLYLRH